MRKPEQVYFANGSLNWNNGFGKQSGDIWSSRCTYDPAISLPGVGCPRETLHVCSRGHGQAQSEQHEEQCKCPSTVEWINQLGYTMEY